LDRTLAVALPTTVSLIGPVAGNTMHPDKRAEAITTTSGERYRFNVAKDRRSPRPETTDRQFLTNGQSLLARNGITRIAKAALAMPTSLSNFAVNLTLNCRGSAPNAPSA
jgi:hypothetical protein